MFSRNNRQMQLRKSQNTQKQDFFSIRKLNIGVVSAMIGSSFLFLSSHAVSAAEQQLAEAEAERIEKVSPKSSGLTAEDVYQELKKSTVEVIDNVENNTPQTEAETAPEGTDASQEAPAAESEAVVRPENETSETEKAQGQAESEQATAAPDQATVKHTEALQGLKTAGEAPAVNEKRLSMALKGAENIELTADWLRDFGKAAREAQPDLTEDELNGLIHTYAANATLALVQSDHKLIADPNIKGHSLKEPNWNDKEEDASEDTLFWKLNPNQEVLKSSVIAEPIANWSIRYEGHHLSPEGQTVIDITHNMFTRATTSVWKYFNYYFAPEFFDMVDWTRSHFLNWKNEEVKFISLAEQGSTVKSVDLFNIRGALDMTSSVTTSPLSLYLKKGYSMADLAKVNRTIQVRLTSADSTKVYGIITDNSGLAEVNSYESFTQSTSIPATDAVDMRYGTLPGLENWNTLSTIDTRHQIFTPQSIASFDAANGTFNVLTKFSKGKTNDNSTWGNDNYLLGFRHAISSKLLDALVEDERGFIGYVGAATNAGNTSIKQSSKNFYGVSKDDFNIIGDMAYLNILPQGFTSNKDTTTAGNSTYVSGGC